VNNLYILKDKLDLNGIFFCFSGPISHELVTEIGSILEQKMGIEDTKKSTLLRVFSMVVEKAQNIIRYSDEMILKDNLKGKAEVLRGGIIAIGYENSHYYVLSGNIIKNSRVQHLREKLVKLQQMDKEELKEYYKKQRKTGPDKYSKGAGLGFIDMAKKSSGPIEFNFRNIDDEFSFFSMKTII